MKSSYRRPSPAFFSNIQKGLIGSALIHLSLLYFLFTAKEGSHIETQAFEVEILAPEAARKRFEQIVSPSASKEEIPKVDTPLRAEKNTATDREQIRRGIEPDAGKYIGKQAQGLPAQAKAVSAQRPAPPAHSKQQAASDNQHKDTRAKQENLSAPKEAPKSTQQEARPKELLTKIDPESNRREEAELQAKAEVKPREQEQSERDLALQNAILGGGAMRNSAQSYQPFSRPIGSGARLLGVPGAADHLPNLPDGDITFLNAKASRFAVFVRRVALQVFSELRNSGWERLSAHDIRSLVNHSRVRAVLSPQGNLLRISLEDSSGSNRFDGVVLDAARKGSRDPHPPPDAVASDGNIHFVFESKSWVQVYPNSRGGGMFERRWLLLGTGLE